MIENFSKQRSTNPVIAHYCELSLMAASSLLEALAAIVQKDPNILYTIGQAIPPGEQHKAYWSWLDQYHTLQGGQETLDSVRLRVVFSVLGRLTDHLSLTDLEERRSLVKARYQTPQDSCAGSLAHALSECPAVLRP